MLFNSFEFCLFFIIVLLFFSLAQNDLHKRLTLLIASYIFYSWTSLLYLGILLLTSIYTYFIGLIIYRKNKSIYLIIGVTGNILILGYFKYWNFIIDSFKLIGNLNFDIPAILLPIGISFYIFHAISYLIDLSRRKIECEKNIVTFALYLSFFPQILAGPIARAENLIPQFQKLSLPNHDEVFIALKTILWGLFCKLMLADKIAMIINPIFSNYKEESGTSILIALCLYSLQIYYDFYGYTKVAIGTAKFFNINLSENFSQPYLAKSIKEFWHRWHITLSSWFRDYLYVPLGGNKVTNKFSFYLIIVFVFIVSGLWHGANWNFLIWGLLHGLYYVFENITCKPLNNIYAFLKINIHIQKLVSNLVVFCSVSFAWLFFRINSMSQIAAILQNIKTNLLPVDLHCINEAFLNDNLWIYLLLFLVMYILDSFKVMNKFTNTEKMTRNYLLDFVLINILLLPLILIGDIGSQEFIYFKF